MYTQSGRRFRFIAITAFALCCHLPRAQARPLHEAGEPRKFGVVAARSADVDPTAEGDASKLHKLGSTIFLRGFPIANPNVLRDIPLSDIVSIQRVEDGLRYQVYVSTQKSDGSGGFETHPFLPTGLLIGHVSGNGTSLVANADESSVANVYKGPTFDPDGNINLEYLRASTGALYALLAKEHLEPSGITPFVVAHDDTKRVLAGPPKAAPPDPKPRRTWTEVNRHLNQHIVDQPQATRVVADAVMRAEAGLNEPGKPLGTFLFVGPTGVGKTELSKALLRFLHQHLPEAQWPELARFNMGEFTEKHSVARLNGAPPGYTDSGSKGGLVAILEAKPKVLLVDEFDKAHPDAQNIFLEGLDEGGFTDAMGRRASYADTYVIVTSNAGSELLADRVVETAREKDRKTGFQVRPKDNASGSERGKPLVQAPLTNDEQAALPTREEIVNHLVTTGKYTPEFLNRFDEIVPFDYLKHSSMSPILKLKLDRLGNRLAQGGRTLKVLPSAHDMVVANGYKQKDGARALSREVNTRFATPLAKGIQNGKVPEGATIYAAAHEGDIKFALAKRGPFGSFDDDAPAAELKPARTGPRLGAMKKIVIRRNGSPDLRDGSRIRLKQPAGASKPAQVHRGEQHLSPPLTGHTPERRELVPTIHTAGKK